MQRKSKKKYEKKNIRTESIGKRRGKTIWYCDCTHVMLGRGDSYFGQSWNDDSELDGQCWSWTDKPAKPARFIADEFYIYIYVCIFTYSFDSVSLFSFAHAHTIWLLLPHFSTLFRSFVRSFIYQLCFIRIVWLSMVLLLLSFPIYSLYLC